MSTRARITSLPWYGGVAAGVAIAVGVVELAIAGRAALVFATWTTRAHDPLEDSLTWFTGLILAAPVVAFGALGWFSLFTGRAALRGGEDALLGVASALALSLGTSYFVTVPAWIAYVLVLAIAGAAAAGLAAWRREVLARRRSR